MLEYKIWSSAADGCVCSLCAKLEGTAVKRGELFKIAGHSVMEPPLHNECRCAVLLCDAANLEPRLRRVYNAFTLYAGVASRAVVFQEFVSAYSAALYFLELLAAASPDELAAAGMRQTEFSSFSGQLASVNARRDARFNEALKLAYDREWADAQSLKTERGRAARLDRFVSVVVASQVLSETNYQYLYKLRTER